MCPCPVASPQLRIIQQTRKEPPENSAETVLSMKRDSDVNLCVFITPEPVEAMAKNS